MICGWGWRIQWLEFVDVETSSEDAGSSVNKAGFKSRIADALQSGVTADG